MILVVGLAALLWGLGALMGTAKKPRWIMIALLFGAVILAQLLLPAGHPIRLATGGSAALWGLLAAGLACAALYRQGLLWLKARARPEDDKPAPASQDTPPAQRDHLTEPELHRYTRHMILHEIGGPGQMRLHRARVLVIGAGGLGAPVLQYLAAAGVGTLGVIDHDDVDLSNLQRQIIHNTDWIGKPKVFSAQAALASLNPHVILRPYHRALTEDIAAELFAEYDLIIDGCDNFATRRLVNKTAVQAGRPLISGALSQWEGQVSLYHPADGSPCYACIFPSAPPPGMAPGCAEAGVLGPLPGIIGALMAAEAVKYLTGAGETLQSRLLTYDALYAQSRTITLHRDPQCPICGSAKED